MINWYSGIKKPVVNKLRIWLHTKAGTIKNVKYALCSILVAQYTGYVKMVTEHNGMLNYFICGFESNLWVEKK
ncbi:hypothetical protein C1N83_26650 [Priestia aryabhattai]